MWTSLCLASRCSLVLTSSFLSTDHVRGRSFVFRTDEFDQLAAWNDLLIQADSERRGVGLGIVDGDVDPQRAVAQPLKSFGERRLIRQRRPPDVQPAAVPEACRHDDERLALPAAHT